VQELSVIWHVLKDMRQDDKVEQVAVEGQSRSGSIPQPQVNEYESALMRSLPEASDCRIRKLYAVNPARCRKAQKHRSRSKTDIQHIPACWLQASGRKEAGEGSGLSTYVE
jgi:hypothetical protein